MASAAPRTARRVVLAGVAVSLCATASLAIGILLFGDFGETEGRILGTTILLASYGLVALPAGFLLDQSRRRPTAAALLGLAGTGLVLALVSVWSGGSSATFGKVILTVTVFALAASQAAALAARRREDDPATVGALFAVSCALAITLAAMSAAAAWGEIGDPAYFRILGALAVLDVLLVVLQPMLALAQPRGEVHHLRLVVEQGEEIESDVQAVDFATAVARAIRQAERDGRRVVRVARA